MGSSRFTRRRPPHHLSPAPVNQAGLDPEAGLSRSNSIQQRSFQARMPVNSEQDCCWLQREAGMPMVIRRFESSRPSQAVRRSEKLSLILAERPANGGLLRIGHQSPGSDFGHSRSEIADR